MGITDKAHDHRAQRRREHITTAAYYLAERRDFAPGSEVDDWLQAEREIASRHGANGAIEGTSQRARPEENMPSRLTPSAADAQIAPHEVQEWAGRLGVDAGALRAAINKVGPDIRELRLYLAHRRPPQGQAQQCDRH